MNQKVAKQIRIWMRNVDKIDPKQKTYQGRELRSRLYYQPDGKGYRIPALQIRLNPECGRAEYRRRKNYVSSIGRVGI